MMTDKGRQLRALRSQGLMLDPLEKKIDACRIPDLRESLINMYNRESRVRDNKLAELQPYIDSLPGEYAIFCRVYYVHGFTIAECADILNKSIRQCSRYKRLIEKGE